MGTGSAGLRACLHLVLGTWLTSARTECANVPTQWPMVKLFGAKDLTGQCATVPYRGVAATKQETTGIEKQAPNFRRSISIPSHLCTCAAYVAITKSAHAAKI